MSLDFSFHSRLWERILHIQIRRTRGLNPTLLDRRRMDYSTKYDFSGEVDETYSYLTKASVDSRSVHSY
ncbi:hypothetical protein AMJ44_00110 [candidate division WOR-1 bacterium DG_54_3]|uniref:Uncharacterized protein n=1 Tax=candidate division WOR-1 bacterium DG_54_3 TaxID=1703775 RepID=A0A0S7Y786_UNCSA|nr:MAG: hypothetical protein AMJ44_00110 [candidate division WOR-1 bacterium DG_54_3]